MKQAQLKSVLMIILFTLIGAVSVMALTVTLNYPNNVWVKSSIVTFNFTPNSRVSPLPYCELWTNSTGSYVATNYTNVPNGTPFIRGIGIADSTGKTLNWSVDCYNGTTQVNSSTYTFGVDSHVPSVTLDSPVDGTYQNSNSIVFKFTNTDPSNTGACQLYHNASGTWASNKTFLKIVSGTQNTSTQTMSTNKRIIWNVYCNDSANNNAWAEDTNRTLITDTSAPAPIKWTLPSNNTASSDQTPLLHWNQTTEPNFQKYQILVSTYLNMSHIIQTQEITNRTANFTTLNTIENDGTYYLQVRAYDLAGNTRNTTYVLYYKLDSSAPVLTLGSPSDGSYLTDTTPDFNITMVDVNPKDCVLLLSKAAGTTVSINRTIRNLVNGTEYNITAAKAMNNGVHKFNIECNDSKNTRVNVSSSLLTVTIDTISPTHPNITSTWGNHNNTDNTPMLTWKAVRETNFARYLVEAINMATGTVAYAVNVTTSNATNYATLSLTDNIRYNFSVTAYDLAGNSRKSGNTTKTQYYVDPVCGTLNAGWNACGATWTTAKNLSRIGLETSATFVTVWNKNSHSWSTCNYAVSASGTNCNIDVAIAKNKNHAVWIYVNSSTQWENRTWVATRLSSNVTLTNITNGWNLEAGFFRGGKTFGILGQNFKRNNVTMFSMPYNNGTSVPYVNVNPFYFIKNTTTLDYGRAMWIYYNSTGNTTFNVGTW